MSLQVPELKLNWIPEKLTTAHLIKIGGIELQRTTVAFCILSNEGACRYPEELQLSLDHLVSRQSVDYIPYWTIVSKLPALCGALGDRACRLDDRTYPQTIFSAEKDPGFCRLASKCKLAKKETISEMPWALLEDTDSLLCLSDGSVLDGRARLAATIPCSWQPRAVGPISGRCTAAQLILDIRAQRVSRNQLELVIARFEEDIAWTELYAPLTTVYNKGTEFKSSAGSRVVSLHNIGYEQHSYLWHLVHHYNNLSERTVFAHARKPSCGFFLASGAIGGHLAEGVSLSDYLTSRNDMVLTMRFDSNLSKMSIRSIFADLPAQEGCTATAPVPSAPHGDHCDYWLPWEANDFNAFIRQRARHTDVMSYRDFFHAVFGCEPPAFLYFTQGAQFAASRAALQRVGLDTYSWLLTQLEAGRTEIVYYLEFSWFYLLHGVDAAPINEPQDQASSESLPFLAHVGGISSWIVRRRHLSNDAVVYNNYYYDTLRTTGTCQVSNLCVRSSGYPSNAYGNSESCIISGVPSSPIILNSFAVENAIDCFKDFMLVNGRRYCGTFGPFGVVVTDGKIVWSSDSSNTASGWELCWDPFSPPSQTPSLPPRPPSSPPLPSPPPPRPPPSPSPPDGLVVDNVTALHSALLDGSVQRIFLLGGRYSLARELIIQRNISVYADSPGTVVLEGGARHRVISIVSSVNVLLDGLNITRGSAAEVCDILQVLTLFVLHG